MTATEQTQASPARITRWTIGRHDNWATLEVDLGVIQADVHMTSRTAREFALAVLAEQGPYLGYQPPNESMREIKNAPPFGSGRHEEPGWKARESVRRCHEELSELVDRFGTDAFGWALQRLHGS